MILSFKAKCNFHAAISTDMHVFVTWLADDLGASVEKAVEANDQASLRQISALAERGTAIWRTWAELSGGSIVSYGCEDGRVEVDAEKLSELPKIKTQYENALGGTSVGIGRSLAEADWAVQASKLRGGGQIVLFTPEVREELQAAEEKMAKAESATSATPEPATPPSRAASLEEQFHAAAKRARGQRADDPHVIRAKVVQVLQEIKQQAPIIAQLKEAAPDAYASVMDLVTEMISIARQAQPPQEMAKAEGPTPIDQAAFLHKPSGVVYGTGPFHDIDQLPIEYGDDWEDGFLARDGRFLTRQQAAEEVHKPQGANLQSEDLPEQGLGRKPGQEHLGRAQTNLPVTKAEDGEHFVVYRLENDKGEGPYKAGALSQDEESAYQPPAHTDFEPDVFQHMDERGLEFGFETPGQAVDWFGPHLKVLKEKGFKLVKVPAKKVFHSISGRQCIFEPEKELAKAGNGHNFGRTANVSRAVAPRAPMGPLGGTPASRLQPKPETPQIPGAAKVASKPMPMPHAPLHHHVRWPVGSVNDTTGPARDSAKMRIKVVHKRGLGGAESGKAFVQVQDGQVLSQDGHSISSRQPSGK